MVVGCCPTKKYADEQTVKRVHFALLYLHIQTSITSWVCAALYPLVKLQKRILRIMRLSHNVSK